MRGTIKNIMEKYPIVILPGWMLSGQRYKALASELNKRGYEVFAVEFPGFEHGEEITRPWNLTDYVDYLKTYLKEHRIKKAVFIGHSFGGRVALKLLSQEPEYGQALVLTGTPGFLPVKRSKYYIAVWLAKLGGAFFSLPGLKIFKDEIRRIYYLLVGAKDFYNAKGYIRETFKNVVAERLEDYMKSIQTSTLLLWGEKDALVGLKVARQMQRAIKNSRFDIIPDHGHSFLIKEPKKYADKLETFLKTL